MQSWRCISSLTRAILFSRLMSRRGEGSEIIICKAPWGPECTTLGNLVITGTDSSNSGKILDHREKYFNFVVSDGLMPVRRDALRTANINFS